MKISKIYLIDDDEVFALKFVNDIRQYTGYKIYHFGSVETGLEYAKIDLPEVVFLDHELDGQNGIDSIPKWLKINPKVRIIIVTNSKNPDNLRKAIELDVTEYLNKDLYLRGSTKCA